MVSASSLPWLPGVSLALADHQAVRAETIFACCKWDPQVGDVSVLHDTPLVLRRAAWAQLHELAERLAAETMAAERELSRRPELHKHLGLGWRLCRALRRAAGCPAEAPFRVLRFDFHWAENGWRVTEVNSDVPGGFIEASGFTRLVAERVRGTRPAGDPAQALADAVETVVPPGGTVGLVHATAYVDDRQVMIYLSRVLRRRGVDVLLLSPADVRWEASGAIAHDTNRWRSLAAVYRFFPAEWLPNLGWTRPWHHYFRASATPQLNPPTALLTQSKRFPLVWDALETPLPTWRSLSPVSQHPHRNHVDSDHWVVKPALGRVGDGIGMRGVTQRAEQVQIHRAVCRHPRYWAAQERFAAVPWTTPSGPLYPALGVYVIAGQAAGIYGRAARQPLIDGNAFDIAVLVESDSDGSAV